jgi:hypothetical protein
VAAAYAGLQDSSPRDALLGLHARARQELEQLADETCRELRGQEVRGTALPVRAACATGRIAVRWTTSALYLREHPRPAIDLDAARIELCRRHLHAFGPTTPKAFAWWAGVPGQDARITFELLASELMPVELAGQDAWLLAADEPALRAAGHSGQSARWRRQPGLPSRQRPRACPSPTGRSASL